ncbi:MAG: hypothetical protein AAGC44_00445 [Planctomycetota bacterium]
MHKLYLIIRNKLIALHDDEKGATTLEWTLLLAAIALPGYALIRYGLALLAAHHGLVTTMNQMPF